MNTIHRILAVLAALVLIASTAAAQQPQQQPFLVPIAERLERATVTDDEGLLQWAEYEAERCINCKGLHENTMTCLHCERFDDGDCEDCPECHNTRRAPCRICAGTGEMPDILERAPCPTCFGASVTRCFICNGKGRFSVAGSGDRLQKCGCCDGVGGFPCTTCKGERWVAPPKLKPSVGAARLSDLRKAQEALLEVSALVDTFETAKEGRKDIKAFAKLMKPARRYFPALMSLQKHFESATKDMTKGTNWKHYPDAVAASAESTKQALEYYIKHQNRVLDLCIVRAEKNEETAGGKKK